MKKLVPFIIILLLSFFAVKPLFYPGFFPVHDNVQVQRVYEMTQSLKDGMFPVRWVRDLGYGYGYPIFNFYGPFAYYIGALFLLSGFSALVATKMMIGIGILLSGIGIYVLGKYLWGIYGGMLAAVFYTYATYHAVDIFVRGDIGELYAYGLLPLAIFGFIAFIQEKKWQYLVTGAISFALLICSHNLSALMVSPLLLLLAIWGVVAKKTWSGFVTFLLGLFIASFYWLPALTESVYTNVLSQITGGADFHNNFVCPMQFWYSPWEYGGSVPGCNDGLSFMVGKLHIIFSFVALLLAVLFFRKNKAVSLLVFVLFFGFLFSLFIQTQYALVIWNAIKLMAYFQYPWRFLILSSFFTSLLAGSCMVFLHNIPIPQKHLLIPLYTAPLVLSVLLLQTKFFIPEYYTSYPSSYYTTSSMLRFTASKISDEYMPKTFSKPKTIKNVPQGFITAKQVTVILDKTQEKVFITHFTTPQTMHVNLTYFPAWHLYSGSTEIFLQQVKNGMSARIPSGNHTIRLEFQQTNLEKTGDTLSLAGIVFLFLGIIYYDEENS
ncbi:MAG TPA: 6-pyruvoyl-tetrahydropterin synthase-related protein [Patescibacteria group bacterium]|nr:6-pyruvoyl-tetrahydropterin synthase-related protein [Patescibacteria group bacterium]